MEALEASAKQTPATAPVLSFGVRVLFVGVAINILQQFIGLTAISYSGPLILQRLGYHMDEAFLGVLLARSLKCSRRWAWCWSSTASDASRC